MPSDLGCRAWSDARDTILQLGLTTPKQSEAPQDQSELGFGSRFGARPQGGSPDRQPSAPPRLPDAVLRRSIPAERSSQAAVAAAVAAAAAVRSELEEESEEDHDADAVVASCLDLPSEGSALHASGACQPCGWFWKLGGCQNGRQCNRCHLCPEGELKTRKKAKHTLFRLGLATPQSAGGSAQEMSEPRRVRFMGETPKTSNGQQSQAAAKTIGFRDEPAEDVAALASRPSESPADACRPILKLPPRAAAEDSGETVGSITVELLGGETAPGRLSNAAAASPADGDGELAFPPGLAPAGGSQLHGTGTCQPCAWFWKADGCKAGLACDYCHQCPRGELKARKRYKHSLMRLGLVTPKVAQCTRNVTFGDEVVAALSKQESDNDESTSAAGSAEELAVSLSSDDAAAERQAPGARSSDGSVMPVPPGLELPPETPSHGSTLHQTGACQPCAWFWKPGSCQNGSNCSYCHLCPESELKDRRKSKHAQMRLGLTTPKVQRANKAGAQGGDSTLSADAPEFMPTFGSVALRMGLATPRAPCGGPFDWQAPDLRVGMFGMEVPVCGGA